MDPNSPEAGAGHCSQFGGKRRNNTQCHNTRDNDSPGHTMSHQGPLVTESSQPVAGCGDDSGWHIVGGAERNFATWHQPAIIFRSPEPESLWPSLVSVYLSHQPTRAGLARGEWGREGQVVGQGLSDGESRALVNIKISWNWQKLFNIPICTPCCGLNTEHNVHIC